MSREKEQSVSETCALGEPGQLDCLTALQCSVQWLTVYFYLCVASKSMVKSRWHQDPGRMHALVHMNAFHISLILSHGKTKYVIHNKWL